MRFEGKVCLVTGAGSGIGKATAMQFAKEGGKVTVIDLNQDHGNQTVQEITANKGEAFFAKCDVGNIDNIKGVIKASVDRWSKIDVVVNDAAMMTFKPIVNLPDEDWDKVLDVNVRSGGSTFSRSFDRVEDNKSLPIRKSPRLTVIQRMRATGIRSLSRTVVPLAP